MSNEKKLKPMSDISFKGMMWCFKLIDLFRNPRRLLKRIPLKEGMTVVDYGCGSGRYTLPVAETVGTEGKVFAVDIQPLAIETVKEKAAKTGLTNIEAIPVDSYNTGIQDSSIDIVLLIDIIHSTSDCNALFYEIHRILKKDGIIFMEIDHMKTSRAREIVEGTGLFKIVECQGRNILAAPINIGNRQ